MDYTVQDTETGKTVTFAWYGDKPPTDADMSDVFAKAKGAVATKYVDNTDIKTAVDKLANDEFTAMPSPSISQGKPASLWDKFFETFEPSWEARKAQAAISMQKARETGKPPSYFEPTTGQAIESGFQSSVSGLLYRGKKPDKLSPEQLKELPATQRILAQGAQLAGDLPFMVPGAIIGSAGGGPAAPLTALGGAFALPSGIRKVLMDKYEKGEIDSFGEFWRRTIGAADETLKGFATGVATGAAGAVGGFPAEIAAMVTVGSALEGQIPEPKDFIDAAILIGGMKMSTSVARKLRTIYADTGKTPNNIMMDISEDPFIRKELLQDKETIPEVYQKAKEVSKAEKPTLKQAYDTVRERLKGMPHVPISDVMKEMGITDLNEIKPLILYGFKDGSIQGSHASWTLGEAHPSLTPEMKAATFYLGDQRISDIKVLREPTPAEKVEPAPAEKAVAPKTIQDIDSEFSKEIDTVAKEMAQRGSVGIGGEAGPMFTFSNPDIEARIQAAKGIKSDSFWQTIKDKFVSLSHQMTREFELLPKTSEFAQLQFDLRKLAKQKGVTGHDTLTTIQGITLHLDKPDYNLFWRKVLLDDLAQVAKEGKPLPFGFDKNTLKAEKASLDKAVNQSPSVKDALERRSTVWTALKNDYTKSMKAIGFDVSEKLSRKDYFRHQVLDYMELKNITGTGRKLKTPADRGFLKKRKGSELDINTDYIQAEHEVMAQMLYDLQVAKTIDAINRNYNIADVVRKQAKAENLENWRDAIPDGYDTWQPRQGSVFYLADSIPAKLAEMLQSGALEEIGLTKDQIGKVLAVGGKRKEYVLKNEIIDTLNNLTTEKADNLISTAHAKIIKSWKIWQLISPRRYFKYNLRNLTGDADGAFAGRPSVFMEMPNAVKELWGVYAQGKTMQGELRDWFERGGMQSNLQAHEMGELNKFGMFMHLQEQKTGLTKIPLKVWQTYWKTARLSTDFRESILRFAAYRRFLKEMTESPERMPKDFAASIPEEVKGLNDIKDRAYMMSNDLLGAYDRVGIMGQNIREHLFPFWSWKEANFRRYIRISRNAAESDQVCELIGRKAVGTLAKTPFIAVRIGKFMLKATAFWSALQVWNNAKFKEEEDMLPPEVKNRPHIVLGRNEDGEILAFTRVGALGDVLDWFGLGVAPQYVDALMKGKMTLKEIAIDMAKAPVNIIVQGGEPFVKLGAELLSRRAIFPDVFNLRTVRDRSLHVMRSVGLENEYIALTQKPSKGYLESLEGLFIYKYDPIQIAYNDFMVLKRKFLETKGKGSEGFWLTPRGNALYDAKLALRYKDDNAAMNAIAKYFELGGDLKGIKTSIDNMAPLAGLTQQEKRELRDSLDNEDLRTLIKAQLFFEELQTGQDMSKLIYGKQ